MIRFLVLLLLLVPGMAAHAANPAPLSGNDLVQADLLAEPQSIRAGEPFWVGLRMRMAEHWHVYWRNPGDSGLAPEIAWDLPQGFTAGPIVWPTPSAIPVAHLVNYGYEGETILLTQITPPARLPAGEEVVLKADVNWLVCEKECVPGEASLSLSLPSDGAAGPNPEMAALFEAARQSLPMASPWSARMQVAPEGYALQVMAPGLKADTIRKATFLPFSETLIEHAASQLLSVDAEGLSLRLKRSLYATDTLPPLLGGLLLIEEDIGGSIQRQAFEFTSIPTGAVATPTTASLDWSAILQAALLALLGGVILNLMPCVFPVLSIKILALVEHAGQGRARMRRHGMAYTLGVLLSFAALAVLLLGLRAAGAQIGWGFQLQMPLVVAGLAYLLFVMGLSLSGVIHFGGRLAGLGDSLTRRGGYQGSFFTGVLATIVATPCTAPFMGAAVGFALTQPAVIGIAVFLALGFGLALPFLLLTFIPQLAERLPRPGLWMERVKQALAFPLYATVAWLIWVLSQQVDGQGLFAALLGLVLLGMAAWSFGLRGRIATATAALAMIAAGVSLYAVAQNPVAPGAQQVAQAGAGSSAQAYSRQRLEALVAEGRPVFVNMTAAWCITCLVNERTALSSDSVQAAFKAKNIAYLKGDWTNQDPEITRVLEQHGRSGVPLYLLLAGGETVVLPQILTPAIVLEHLELVDRVAVRGPVPLMASVSNPTSTR
ncbi:protein-disulfide reductase DsbD family protein [Ferrovibrio sp.]|uniref:protein-disulfide reductase DsbD family protein n=1 Tax=Ferrovibrio sp. TaxID=1917215 RepID=UPI00391D9E19